MPVRSNDNVQASRAEPLGRALLAIVQHPVETLLVRWNWKSGAVSAILRALVFLLSNLRASRHQAFKAAAVEALFAIFAAGLLGATTQRLRWACPERQTALVIFLGLPLTLVCVQAGVHHLAGTPFLRIGLIASFAFASLASGFSWFAQRRGLLLTDAETDPDFSADLRAVPQVLLAFVTAPFRRQPGSPG